VKKLITTPSAGGVGCGDAWVRGLGQQFHPAGVKDAWVEAYYHAGLSHETALPTPRRESKKDKPQWKS